MEAAVIGAGFIGQLHRQAWQANRIPVRVMVDPYISEADKRKFMSEGVEIVATIDQAFAVRPNIRAASVCTPPGQHRADLESLLHYEVHILMEKPVSASKDDYLYMMCLAGTAKTKTMIGLTQRFYPEVQQAANWIRAGKIGEPVAFQDTMILSNQGLPAWYEDRKLSGGGIYITNGVHLLDRMQYVLDSELDSIHHTNTYVDDRGLDHIVHVTGRLKNCTPFQIHLEWSEVKELQRTVIFGSEGRIELQTWQHATLYDQSGHCETFAPYRSEESFSDRTLRGLTLEIQAFLEGIQSGHIPKGLTLEEHMPTMIAIWKEYDANRGRKT